MRQDLQYAFRILVKNPAISAVVIIAIALGIGPNSAVFSIINAVLLRPLPYRDSDRVVMLWETNKQRGLDMVPLSGPTLNDWKARSRSFVDMAPAFTIPEYGFNVTGAGEPERVPAAQGAANLFSVLGVDPLLGRSFRPEEDRPGGEPVVMISHAYWVRRFHSSRDVIGQHIGLDGRSHTIVGVLPGTVDSLARVDVWIPIAQDLSVQPRGNHNYGIMARLKDGVTPAQAQAELSGIAKRLEQDYPATNAGFGALVIPINELLAGPVRPALLVLMAAAGFLLLIACANVAGILLARAAARTREIALRAAVGASRWRIVRQLLTESVLLGTCGGLLGVLLGAWSIRALRSQLPDGIPRLKEMGVDARVLVFGLVVSILTGILFGLVPALRASKSNLNETLKEGGGKGAGGTSQRPRALLLVGEVALAVVLLVGAGLMLRSFLNVTTIDPGFRAANVLTMQLNLPDSEYADLAKAARFARSVTRRLEALPGVRSVAAVNMLPARGSLLNLRSSAMLFQVDGEPAAVAGQEPVADYRVITPGFLDAMGIALRKGRAFTEQDGTDKPGVALINETMARRYYSGVDPVGRRIRISPFALNVKEIVGVIPDLRMHGLEGQVSPAIFVPFEQAPQRRFSIVVHTAANPADLASAVRAEILALDGAQPVSDVRTMEDVLSDSLLLRRLSVWMLGIFALLALSLATIGVYGLTSYAVTRRTHEIGLRMALGASEGNILRLVVGRGLLVALAGIALGLPGAFALARVMRGLLFGVTATDLVVFVVGPLLLASASAAACYVPARRAARIDPMEALRYE